MSDKGENPLEGYDPNALPQTRSYQQEMLEQSLHRNIIIALDTGSGKTHIAVLRLKHEMERRTNKISWFFAPTVGLCEQQRSVIQRSLPVPVGLISGALEPDQWKDAALWMRVLRDHKIMISTPQVLLDALRHGYINLGRDISLLVFDEAHHAVDNHPYNRVMLEFYRPLPTVPVSVESQIAPGKAVPLCRPAVLGLTASPIFGGNTEKAFRTIENNLDATICAPVVHRRELLSHVHRPAFKHVMYEPPSGWDRPFSTNLASLQAVVKSVDINRDPAVISLRQKLPTLARGTPEYERTDQRLSKAIHKKKTFTHTGLTQFQRAAEEICEDIGGWAADWYVWTVVQEARKAARVGNSIISLSSWGNKEKKYLLDILDRVHVTPVSLAPDDILDDSTEKVHALVNTLLNEKAEAEAANEAFSALVFVERRDSVFALAELLKKHPVAGREFSVGNLVGTSESTHRHSFLDITRVLLDQKLDETLEDFRLGTKNVIVSTSVAEEGIDIQACGCVVRWDPPPNMASWVQSRGRARRKRSVFVSLFPTDGGHRKDVHEWERLEKEMVDRYTDPKRAQYDRDAGWGEDGEDEDAEELIYTNPTTGAKITLQSALPHLEHFCAMIPFSAHTDNRPIYDVDPPEMPPGWHENTRVEVPLPTGPFGATVTLPRAVPLEVRSFTVPREFSTKISAFRHVAFVAYTTLHKYGLLNDHFLPFTTVIDPEREEEVREMLKDVERRAGMANVTGQMDPWRPRNEGDLGWHAASLRIGLLPPLLLLTKNPQSEWTEQDGPRLHRKGEESMIVTLRRLGKVDLVDNRVIRATEYTRRIFWAQSGARMNWDNTSFAYLILPVNPPQSDVWEQRRAWWRAHPSYDPQPSRQGLVNAQKFGRAFDYPEDIVLIRQGTDFGKTYRFVRWAHEPIDAEEEEKLRTRYETVEGYTGIIYPILVVQPLPARVNFLAPLPPRPTAAPTPDPRFIYLLPQFASVILQGQQDAEYAALLPSTLRALEVTTTVDSLKEHLFAATPMESVPQSLMSVAMTAPVSQEPVNYQRLETMGDTVLKFLVSIQLYAEYPLWHEGYLAKQKDHTVSNVRLAKISVRRHIFQWIIRDRLIGKKWKPKYYSTAEDASSPGDALELGKEDDQKGEEDKVAPSVMAKSTETEVGASEKKKPKQKEKKKDNNQLSTKVLADVIESLIGAAYVHGGLSLGRACTQFFDLGLKWDTTSARISAILSRTVTLDQYPAELQYVERMLGYTFKRKALLIEALTHASYQEPLPTPSYGRLEFLGDAVLDMAVTPYIFASKKNYSPGHIHLRRSAAVNMHFLAFVCLRAKVAVDKHMPRPTAPDWRVQMTTESQDIYLWQCMLHSSSTVIDDQNNTFARFRRLEKEISEALESGDIFPWAALTRMQAPKFFSDVVESLIGAVFLDAGGDMEIATEVIRTLGIMRVLERVVDEDLDVLHPLSRLSVWAQQSHKELELISEKEKGKAVCRVLVDGEEIARDEDAYHGKVSLNEVKFTAAEKAVRILKVREGDEKGRMMMGKRKNAQPDAKL